MKATYIYLNTYHNGYLYVGSHTWKGPEGELDPNYHGSSRVAKLYGWVPVKEEILEVNPDLKLRREHYWIELYCVKYGIAPAVHNLCRSKLWASQFKDGLMLNMHSNDASIINSPEVQTEELKKLRIKRIQSEECRAKWRRSMSNGGSVRFSAAGNSASARKKAMLTRNAFWATPEGKAERSATCRKSAKTRGEKKPQWICSAPDVVAPLSSLSKELGYSGGCGPYDWWRHHGKPNKFEYKGVEFICRVAHS